MAALNLNIEEDLYKQLARRAASQGFDSPEEYSVVVLRTVLEELETGNADNVVTDRLEHLGYLD